MSNRLIIASNRLPYSIKKDEENEGKYKFTQSSGGLVSGLKPIMKKKETLWLGWVDTDYDNLENEQKYELEKELRAKKCVPVFLEEEDIVNYYDGFSNSAIWPLFHYFCQFCEFNDHEWQSYKHVNERFCDELEKVARPGDTIWVHDYHLMLLPNLIRKRIPGVSIGFFLHIPFPSYEMFRILPYRSEVLEGLLGADLIGFHTYDYNRHFLSSCRRVLGIENHYGILTHDDRLIKTDAFPLGIDYELFESTSKKSQVRTKAREYIDNQVQVDKVILSIERLDYTKGIVDSLNAYELFLMRNPEWIENVVFTLIVVPSREGVESYMDLKSKIDEMVGAIQGKFSTQSWAPIDYYYQSFSFEDLCSMYVSSDIMLVSPLRDGMNLVSKEYLATHDNEGGVLILSEMAGSAQELSDALIINPYNIEDYVTSFKKALTMDKAEQKKRNGVMQNRLRQYTSQLWAEYFLQALTEGSEQKSSMKIKELSESQENQLRSEFSKAKKKAIMLDYDGTLVGFDKDPKAVAPDDEILGILSDLSSHKDNRLVIISGRDKDTMDDWFGKLNIDLIAEHGIWLYNSETDKWIMGQPLEDGWKDSIRAELENFVIRTPGSFIEEKDYSLVWHCRGTTEELGERRMHEISTSLSLETESKGLMIMHGNKVLEIKPKNINKGRAAYAWLQNKDCDFILAAGDDTTDEDMFRAIPDDAWTLKVASDVSEAKYYIKGYKEMRQILKSLT